MTLKTKGKKRDDEVSGLIVKEVLLVLIRKKREKAAKHVDPRTLEDRLPLLPPGTSSPKGMEGRGDLEPQRGKNP